MSDEGDPVPAGDLARELLERTTGAGARAATPQRRRAPSQAAQPSTRRDDRDPVRAEQAVADLVEEQGWRSQTTVAAALARWEEIAGPEIAAHVRAEAFHDGVLTLKADSTAWATQLRLLLPTVRRSIDAAVGVGVVADIRIVGPLPPRSKGAWRVPGRGPRDTYG